MPDREIPFKTYDDATKFQGLSPHGRVLSNGTVESPAVFTSTAMSAKYMTSTPFISNPTNNNLIKSTSAYAHLGNKAWDQTPPGGDHSHSHYAEPHQQEVRRPSMKRAGSSQRSSFYGPASQVGCAYILLS